MSNAKLSALLVVVFFLVSCGERSAAEKVVLKSLKDPDPAKFGEFTSVSETAACLTVNAKNSMGGYTGDQEAYLNKVHGKWVVVDIEEDSKERCVSVQKEVSELH